MQISDAFTLAKPATKWTPEYLEFVNLEEVASVPPVISLQPPDDDEGIYSILAYRNQTSVI